MATEIQCKCVGCNSEGWDSYTIAGELYLECATCECKIEGNFVIGSDGWIKQIQKAK